MPVDLPKYPSTEHVPMSDQSPARHVVGALLVLEATLLGISLPIQLLWFFSLGWEGGDEALKHRMVGALPLLGLGALLAAVVSGVGASAVWRDTGEGLPLVATVAGLVAALGLGWVATLQGHLLDPMLGPVWGMLTAPALLALAVCLVVRRAVRPSGPSPSR